jgi:hypothetical protein
MVIMVAPSGCVPKMPIGSEECSALGKTLPRADLLVLIATGLIGCAYRIAIPTRRAAAYFD